MRPTGRALLPLFLPVVCCLLVSNAFAQGGSGRDPKQGAGGGWINNPNGNTFRRMRTSVVVEFRGEQMPQTAARVATGSPRLQPAPTGTLVSPNDRRPAPIGLLLAARDGPARCRVHLPRGFRGGILVLTAANHSTPVLLPVLSETFFVDVPRALLVARQAGLTRIRLTFYALVRDQIAWFAFELKTQAATGVVELRF